MFLEHLPGNVERVVDLGTGGGRLISLVHQVHPRADAVGLDFSPPMLREARERFDGGSGVRLVEHDLGLAVPDLPHVDPVVSGFAIHHLADGRKRSLFEEIHARLEPGGVFLNLEHVASASARLHAEFFRAVGERPEDEDPSDRLVAV